MTETGAQRNETSVTVSEDRDLKSYLVASTLRLNMADDSKIGILGEEVIARFGEFRRIGFAQSTLSLVVIGSLNAVVGSETESHPWNIVASAF